MDDKDSDDYELLPHGELEQLRKDIATAKKGSGDPKNRDLQDAIERLNGSINKLISILEDAQQDIIDEYQESKPVEKLNQLLDQNETIARALITINDRLKGDMPQDASPSSSMMDQANSMQSQMSGPLQGPMQQAPMPVNSQYPQPAFPQVNPSMNQLPQMNQSSTNQLPMSQSNPLPLLNQSSMNQLPQMNQHIMNQPPPMQQTQPKMPSYNAYQNIPSPQFQGQDIQFNTLPPLDAPPPMVPDQGMPLPNKRNKFLGLM